MTDWGPIGDNEPIDANRTATFGDDWRQNLDLRTGAGDEGWRGRFLSVFSGYPLEERSAK